MTFEEIKNICKTYRFKYDFNNKTYTLIKTSNNEIVSDIDEINKAKAGILLFSLISSGTKRHPSDYIPDAGVRDKFFNTYDEQERAQKFLESLSSDLKDIIEKQQYKFTKNSLGIANTPLEWFIANYTSSADYLKDCYSAVFDMVASENGMKVDNFTISTDSTYFVHFFNCISHKINSQTNQNSSYQPNISSQNMSVSPNPTQPQQTGATGTKQSSTNPSQNQTFTTATMGVRPVPKPSASIPTMVYTSRSLQEKINFLKSLQLEVKKNSDFTSELNGQSGVTQEDLSCAYAITQNGKSNVEDLTYREIEKTLFEIVNFPDYNSANTMLQDYMQVLNNAGYVPSYGTLARALQEIDKIENLNLDNKGARREFLREALGKGNQMLADSMKISEYIKGQNNISTPVTHEEQSKVLLKMQDNYDKFGLNPDSNKPKNFKKFIDPQTLPKPNNIILNVKSDEEMQEDIDLHRAYKNYTYQPCPYTIKDDKGEVQDIWNIQPSTLINKLAKTLTHGNAMEIQKMRIICENMKGHFNPSYADMAKLTKIINDFWKLGNDPNVDRAIESLKSIAQDKYNEAFQIAKFNAQKDGRPQATYGEMVKVFEELEKQQQLKKQAQQTSGGYGSGM